MFRFYKISSELVSHRNLLTSLFRSLQETIRSAILKHSSFNMLNNFDASSTASMLASLRFLSTYDGGENVEIARLNSKICDVDFGFGAEDEGGALPQHRGRSSVAGSVPRKGHDIALRQYLPRKIIALVPPTLDSFHPVLSHRRYSVCISDLKCVLNVKGIPRYFASYPSHDDGKAYLTTKQIENEGSSDCALDDWIKVSCMQVWSYYFIGNFLLLMPI